MTLFYTLLWVLGTLEFLAQKTLRLLLGLPPKVDLLLVCTPQRQRSGCSVIACGEVDAVGMK